MVSMRCKMVVQDELKKLGFHPVSVELGLVEITEDLSQDEREKLQKVLMRSGLELMEDKKAILVERIKIIIIEMVHYSDEYVKYKFSNYLSETLGYAYIYLANLFSTLEGNTIEQYIIANKIERVKELLLYDELNLKEISYKLHYSSVAHLSSQFKKITGLTPTHFKQLAQHRNRIALDDL